jgi:hypothetical protein
LTNRSFPISPVNGNFCVFLVDDKLISDVFWWTLQLLVSCDIACLGGLLEATPAAATAATAAYFSGVI